jgi:hypothetical protein
MGLQTHTDVLENRNMDSTKEDNPEIDAEVDLEGEHICALNEIEGPRNKKWIHKGVAGEVKKKNAWYKRKFR